LILELSFKESVKASQWACSCYWLVQLLSSHSVSPGMSVVKVSKYVVERTIEY